MLVLVLINVILAETFFHTVVLCRKIGPIKNILYKRHFRLSVSQSMTSSPRPLPFSFCGLRGSCSNRDRLYMQGSGLGNQGDSLQTIIKYFCWKATSSTQAYKTAFSVSSAFNMLITQVCLGIPEQGNALH